MDPPSSGAPPTGESPQGCSSAPLLGHYAESHPTDLSTDMAPLSCDPSCTESVYGDPPEPPDASTASAHQTKVCVEKTHKSGSASKKAHHSTGGEDARASGHNKRLQATKASVQKQWVPVQKNEEEAGALIKQRSKDGEESSSSSSSQTSSPSVEVCQNQDPDESQKSEECLVVMPLPAAAETSEHPLPQGYAPSDVVSEAAEEQQSPLSSSGNEDDQTSEPLRSLSRTSSLSAKAKEFVPKSTTASSTVLPAAHGQPVVPPLIMPHCSAQGLLSPFPPLSPLSSPHFGGFPLPMAGPPPPPIPVSPMGTMPLLGPPHPGLLNVQIPGPPPPPPAIPPPVHVMHMSTSSLSPILPDPLANQSGKENLETVEDQHQTQISGAAAKPVLTEELKAKIVKQVEFYFSDANLPTDYHLMKFVRKDSQGFVPISVVANFRKVKNLMKNHALVAAALQSSNQLVVSEDGKKVRRLHPLPHLDLEEIQSRTVVAENLPPDHSVEAMEQFFGSVGNVKLVRVCEPEASNGANQASVKLTKGDVLVISNQRHALIEYETVEQAERAVAELADQSNWRSGLRVRLLRWKANKHSLSKSHRGNKGGTDGGGRLEEDGGPSAGDNVMEKLGEEGSTLERSEDVQGSDNTHSDASSKRGRGRGQGQGQGRGKGRGQYHPNSGRRHPVGTPPQATGFANMEAKPLPGPRMPDGTRGFTLGRGKMMGMNPA